MNKLQKNNLLYLPDFRPVVVLFFLLITGVFSAVSQAADSIVVVKENPLKLLKNVNLQNIVQNGFNFWEDEFSGHWAGIDFGLNTLLHTNYTGYDSEFLKNMLICSNSMYINPVQQSIGIQKNHNTIGFITGLGFLLQSYRLDRSTTIEKSPSGEILPVTLFFKDNQKSKFSMVYLTLPVLAEFQFPVNHYNNRVFVSAGFIGGYRLTSHTKIKYRLEKKKEKLKTPGDFSLHKFRYSLMMRAGYRSYQVFCNYDLQTMFRDKMGPEVTPFTFGVTLVSF